MSPTAESLRDAGFRGSIEAERPLAPFTSWRIGGPAELLATPADREDLLLALAWARATHTSWRVLGNGSNLLVADTGVRGLVVRVRRVLEEVVLSPPRLQCGAGASFPAVARRAALAGLAGLEFGAGIPGTVGGAIVMNAGWHEHEVGRFVNEVEATDAAGSVRRWSRERCEFRYRGSRFRDGQCLVLGASFELVPGDAKEIERRLQSFAASRRTHQPTELPSCGSVFLKPEGDFAGRLIEAAGLKGLRIGDVEVSPKHANFFVNVGAASSADVLALVERVEHEVDRRFGVRLVREFELWS